MSRESPNPSIREADQTRGHVEALIRGTGGGRAGPLVNPARSALRASPELFKIKVAPSIAMNYSDDRMKRTESQVFFCENVFCFSFKQPFV